MVEAITKFCPRCQTLKSVAEFNKRGNLKDGVSFYCKECYYRIHVARTYNVSSAAYDAMLEACNNSCELCGLEFVRRPAVDHDHECCQTGGSCGRCVRGLICQRCNTLLGYLETNPGMVSKAYDYIESRKVQP